MRLKPIFSMVLTFIMIACSCQSCIESIFGGGRGGNTVPGTTDTVPPIITDTPESCQPKATIQSQEVLLNGAQNFNSTPFFIVQKGDMLTLRTKGIATLNYGASNIFTLYAPKDGDGQATVKEWDGTKNIVIDAGAGHITETSADPACKIKLGAMGVVEIDTVGTDYYLVVNPTNNQVQLVTFDGIVSVTDSSGSRISLRGSNQAVTISSGIMGNPYDFQGTSQEVENNLQNGLDLFGQPVEGLNYRPPVIITPTITEIPVPGGTSGKITLWQAWGERDTAIYSILKAFQVQYPNISIEVQYVPSNDMRDKYLTTAAAGVAPTLLLGAGEFGPDFYQRGLLTDLRPQITRAVVAPLDGMAYSGVQYQGAVVGLPVSRQGVVIYRNRSRVSEPPATFDNLLRAGASLDTGFFFSGANLYGLSGALMDSKGSPTFNTEIGIRWLQLLERFSEAGPVSHYDDNDHNYFVAGKVNIMVDGTWAMYDLANLIGNDNLVIDPWPMYQDWPMAGFLQTDNLYLSNQVDRSSREAAWQFIQFAVSSQGQQILADTGHIPVFVDTKISDPLMQQAITALAGDFLVPTLPEMSVYWTPMDEAIISALNSTNIEFREAIALRQAEEAIRAALNK